MDTHLREMAEALEKQARENGWLSGDGPLNPGVQRPQFKLPTDNRELHDFARELGDVAAKTQLLFRRDRTPIIVNAKKKRLDPMSAEMFRTWISDFAACYREKFVVVGEGSDKSVIPVPKIRTMNLEVARGVFESKQFFEQLPEIERLNTTRLPVMRTDGRIELLPTGYFEEQGIYTIDDGIVYNEGLTGAKGCEILDDLLGEFPFADDRSKAAMIAAMLTMFCGALLERPSARPGFVFTANSVGAGKTLGAKVATIPVMGFAALRALPRKDEARKVLDMIAMDADPCVIFDNVRGKIQGEDIEAFITSSVWSGRILGESTKFKVDNVTTVFLTGNQSTTSEDVAERCLIIELFVQEADSRERKIRRVIDDAFLADNSRRSEILSALWALVRTWDADGRPLAPSSLMRFDAWSKIVPAIVAHAGFGDCVTKPSIAGIGDESGDMRSLVTALGPATDAEQQSNQYEFDELMAKVKELGLFEDMETRGGRRDSDLFGDDGRPTRMGNAFFGKLFMRYDRRLFSVGERRLRFFARGKGDSRRYIIEAG
jgi:hypothetical protein